MNRDCTYCCEIAEGWGKCPFCGTPYNFPLEGNNMNKGLVNLSVCEYLIDETRCSFPSYNCGYSCQMIKNAGECPVENDYEKMW